jgi:hypothetical protein
MRVLAVCVLDYALNVHVELRPIWQSDVMATHNGYPWRSFFVMGQSSRGSTSVMQPQSVQEMYNQALNQLDVFLFTELLGKFSETL